MNRMREWFLGRCTSVPRVGSTFVFLAALLPAAVAGVQATRVAAGFAQDDGANETMRARRRLLNAVPRDPAVLINVPFRDMPSSPELVNLGKRSTAALERCLADNVEADARARCAIVLQALGDKRALPTLQAALEDWDATVRLRVVKALGAMPDKSSVAPLIRLFERKDEDLAVRSEIVRALGSISDKRVVALLRKELQNRAGDGGGDLRAAAFDALWLHRHLMDRNTLIGDVAKSLASDDQQLVLSATFAASELRATKLTAALIPLMESANPEIANKAIYALGRIGDKTATKALLARLPDVRESRMLNNLAFALERLDKNAFYAEIAKTIEHKQAVIRLNSAFVLGDVTHEEGLPLLRKALSDASDFVRTSAVAAIGKLALDGATRDAALAALEPLTNDANLSLREAAIYAVHALSPGGRTDLLHDRLFRGLDPQKQRPAIRRAAVALGRAGDARVRDYLVNCAFAHLCDMSEVGPILTKTPRDADTGRVLFAWARGDHRMTPLVATLRPAGATSLAMSSLRESWGSPDAYEATEAMKLLGGLGDTSAVELLDRRTGTELRSARIVALVAAGRLGHGPAAGRLAMELDDVAAESLPEVSRALGLVVEPTFRAGLNPLLEERTRGADTNLAIAAAAVRLTWEPEAGFFRFLDALASTSSFERELAARYLAKNRDPRVTWAMRRALAREGREDVRDRLRALLDERGT